jgi:hypothetical protein
MAKSSQKKENVTIHFVASTKLSAYLYDIIDEEGHGNNPTAVVQSLIWKAVYDLIANQTITRRPGKAGEG